jgi:hypothetical protein
MIVIAVKPLIGIVIHKKFRRIYMSNQTEIREIISDLCGIDTTGENVKAINKAIDFLDGLLND